MSKKETLMGNQLLIVKNAEYTFSTEFLPYAIEKIKIPITTPLTFPFFNNSELLLIFDKNNQWNPIGGHIEADETWQEALKRECLEEAGITIANLTTIGYLEVKHLEKLTNSKYPAVSAIPIVISTILQQIPMMISEKSINNRRVTVEEARKLLATRSDNLQMLNIFNHSYEKYKSLNK